MSIQSLREKINLIIQPSKERNLHYLRYISFFISIITISVLLAYYGFEWTASERQKMMALVKFSFTFYIINFLIKLFYSFDPKQLIKRNWLEALLMLLLVIDGTSKIIFGSSFTRILLVKSDAPDLTPFYIGFIQVYLLIIVLLDLSRATRKLKALKISPPSLMIFSYVFLIFLGTIMLMMPNMTVQKGSMDFFDALFTAASAGCITGLAVVETYSFFTLKGQLIILFLIKIGGLSIISFATFFASLLGSNLGLKHTNIMKSFLSTETLSDARLLLKRIVSISIMIELLGVVFIFFAWPKELEFNGVWEKIYFSFFHSISAFNSAGFSLFSNSFDTEILRQAYFLKLSFIFMMFVGALGIAPLLDFFHPANIKARFHSPWKKPMLSSRIAIYSSLFLTLLTFLLFYSLEFNNVLKNLSFGEKIVDSLFQSVVPRSTGFNSLDIGALTSSSTILIILMMFIGGNSGSTGGGLKTSTFTLLILSAASTISGKKRIELDKQSVSFELINKAFSIFLFMSGYIFISVFILTITDEKLPLIQVVFEAVSAICNVGLSTGITSEFSNAGKLVLVAGMFVGRVGILTLAFSLSRKVISSNYKYPKTHIMIG